jgi:hypothetical protein
VLLQKAISRIAIHNIGTIKYTRLSVRIVLDHTVNAPRNKPLNDNNLYHYPLNDITSLHQSFKIVINYTFHSVKLSIINNSNQQNAVAKQTLKLISFRS